VQHEHCGKLHYWTAKDVVPGVSRPPSNERERGLEKHRFHRTASGFKKVRWLLAFSDLPPETSFCPWATEIRKYNKSK
jgi:hypothetical protein